MSRPRRQRKPSPDGASAAQRPGDGRGALAEAAAVTDRLRPWLLGAACAWFVARPLYPSESAAMYGDGLPMVMLWIALAVFWLLGVIGRSAFRVRFGWTDAAVALLVLLHTTAAVWAAVYGSPRPAVNMLWEWIGYGLSFFMLRQLVAGPRETRALLAAMVAVAVALAGHGLYQYFYKMPARVAEYEKDPDLMLKREGMWIPPNTPERKLFEDRLRSKEPIASFALANSLAGYLAPWMVVLVGIGVGGRTLGKGTVPFSLRENRDSPQVVSRPIPSRKRLWLRALTVGGCALLIAGCLVLTKSRSAYLATLLGLLLVGVFCRAEGTRIGWKAPAAAAAILAVLVAGAVAVRGLDVEVLSEATKSLGYRVQYWRATLGMIGDHPLLGCGPGQFRDAYTAHKLVEASEEVADPHNFLLEVWATAGTPAMLALLAVLGCFAFAQVRQGRLRQEPCAGFPGSTAGATPADRPVFVLAGLVLGILVAALVGLIGEAPPGLEVQWIGLPLAAVTIAVLYPWIVQGELSAALPTVAIVALLVNLLAAGGIGFPGVAGTLWLLLALGLNQAEPESPRKLPRMAGFAGLVLVLALAVACYSTAYRPVLEAQAALRAAERSQARREAFLQAAAMADPLSAEPWIQLAATAFEQWQQAPVSAKLEPFEQYTATALQLAPHSSPVWLATGDRYLEVFYRPGVDEAVKKEAVRKAVAACRRAVELYPNSGLHRAKLAMALEASGDEAGFQEQAETAIKLDELTPHSDKKLRDEARSRLLRGPSGKRQTRSAVRP